MAQIVKFIHAVNSIGAGTKEDPIRTAQQLWTGDGQLVLQFDPHTKEVIIKDELLCKNSIF